MLTPLKLHSRKAAGRVRYVLFEGFQPGQKLTRPVETIMLIRERVAQINVCLFCLDIGRSFTIKASMNEAKFDALEE